MSYSPYNSYWSPVAVVTLCTCFEMERKRFQSYTRGMKVAFICCHCLQWDIQFSSHCTTVFNIDLGFLKVVWYGPSRFLLPSWRTHSRWHPGTWRNSGRQCWMDPASTLEPPWSLMKTGPEPSSAAATWPREKPWPNSSWPPAPASTGYPWRLWVCYLDKDALLFG